jgi:hypothetical protein
MKKLILAAAFVVTATSAALAQGVYVAPGYDAGGGYYNYAPRDRYYDSAPGYGYQGYGYGWRNNNDAERGGPGPRVGPGSGMGIGAVR